MPLIQHVLEKEDDETIKEIVSDILSKEVDSGKAKEAEEDQDEDRPAKPEKPSKVIKVV